MESGTSLTTGAGPGTGRKSKWNTIFRLEIQVGNFILPLKTFRLFWKFSSRASQNGFTIYSSTKISGIFFQWLFFFFLLCLFVCLFWFAGRN